MNTKTTPAVMALLVASWLISIFGLVAAGYLIIYRSDDINSLISSFLILLGALFLAGVSRILGNMGQVFFELKIMLFQDLRKIIERITTIDQKLREQSKEQLQAIRESSDAQVKAVQDSSEAQVKAAQESSETQVKAVQESSETQVRAVQESSGAQVKAVQESSGAQVKAVQESSEAQVRAAQESTRAVTDNFTALDQETKHALGESLAQINLVIREQLQAVQAFSENMTELYNGRREILNNLKEQLQNIHDNLGLVKNLLEQTGCDSKDVSQNIYQIKSFFEQIERHLDLKR